MKVAYIDDEYALAEAYLKKTYGLIEKKVIAEEGDLTYKLRDSEKIFGYKIYKNGPLSKLYEMDFFVVKFAFSNIDTTHSNAQEKVLSSLFYQLSQAVRNQKGYYNIRIPAHLVDVIRAYNNNFKNSIFCGGSVNYISSNSKPNNSLTFDKDIFLINEQELEENEAQLLDLAYTSFDLYQGQYHISPVTSNKAGQIYSQWLKNDLEIIKNGQSEMKCLVIKYKETLAGFLTFSENAQFINGVLNAISYETRNIGLFHKLIEAVIIRAHNAKKIYISSTQLDNFAVQKVWNSLGMKPYNSFYNFHFDSR